MKINKAKERIALFLMFALSFIATFTVNKMNGQLSITAGSTDYTQNFNGLGTTYPVAWSDNSTLSGWYARTTATASNAAPFSTTGVASNTGTTTAAGLYSFATTAGATDRALGYVPSNSFSGGSGTGSNFVGWRLANNTGANITSITVTYTGEQYRKENVAAAHTMLVSYQTGTTVTGLTTGTYTSVASLTFSTPIFSAATATALDGNNAANRAVISASIDLGATPLANGQEIMIRWADLNDSGNDHWMAIDDVTVNATTAAAVVVTPSVSSLTNFGSVAVSSSSASQSFTVTASGLASAVSVTAPTGFQVSTDDVTFSSSISLTQTAGFLDGAPVTVYVRFSPSAPGAASGNVTLTSGSTTANVSVSGTGITSASNTSDIIVDGSFAYTSNIDYASYQASNVTNTNSVAIGQFIIRDGGASPDADALPTILNAITFNAINAPSIRSVALYDGATELGEVVGGATLSFTSLTVNVADDATKTLTVYATFNSTVIDNHQFSLTLASADDDNSGSLFGTLGTVLTSVSGDVNKIEVTASTLVFFAQPTNTASGSAMSPNVVVRAVDGLSNLDVDHTSAIDITSTGTLTGSPVSVVPTIGVATFSGLTHTTAGTGLQLTATSGSLSGTSNTFNIINLIAAWDFTGESATVGAATSAAEVYDALLNNSASQSNLTRGAGAAASVGTNSFRTQGFQDNGIATSNTDYFQFTLSPAAGNAVSVSTIDARQAGTVTYAAAPGVSSQFAYSLNGTTFTLIGSPQVIVGSPSTIAQIDVSGISALQNVSSGTITFRYYASGQTTTGGWGFNSPAAGQYGLAIGGSVAPVDCNNNTACNYNPLATGSTQCQFATTTYYIDIDGDGYASGTIVACSPSTGYTATVLPTGDCDDNSATAYPSATEVLCDGIDNDCDSDATDDGVYGCQDPLASDYNSAATCAASCTYTGSFTPGNLVVSRLGAGTAYPATSNTTYAVFMEQITPTGTAVSTLPMPTNGAGRLTQAASSTAEGFLSRTPNGDAILFAGYNAAPGVTALTGLPRVANIVDLNYSISQVFSSSTLYSANNFRSVTSDGTNYWTSGSGVGINYVTGGTPTVISSAITNTRVINTFNGNLYFSTGSGTAGIYKVGTGLPTSSTTNTLVVSTGAGSSPYDFVFSPDGNTLYVADDRTTTAGGIYKFTFDGSVWTQAAQFNLGTSYPSTSSLVVDFYTYAQPKLYVVARLNLTSQSIVASFDDSGANGAITPSFTTISSSPAFTTYRGIEFAPCTSTIWYADADGDGYGNLSTTLSNCTQPYGYVANSTDCNDALASANPAATEICDGLDNDCNGIADNGLTFVNYYNDADGDTYGSGAATNACQSPGATYVTNNIDCNDAALTAFPGGTEVCGNSIDEDCSGADLACPQGSFSTAIAVANIGQFGTGVQSSQTVNLSTGTNTIQSPGLGLDKWFSFTASANAMRIAVVGSSLVEDDNDLSLYETPTDPTVQLIPLVSENDVHPGSTGAAADGGSETLIYDQLIVGDVYYLCVRNNNNIAGNVSLTLSNLNASTTDIALYTNGTNTFTSACQNFKVKFRPNSAGYTINRWNSADISGTPSWSYAIPVTSTVASTICQLGKIAPANLSGSNQTVYVTVDVLYNLTDAFGTVTPATARANAAASFQMANEADLNVRTTDRCAAGFKSTTSSIATNRSVCGTTRYVWEMSMVYPQTSLPLEVQGPVGGSRILMLNSVPALANGQRYDVRIAAKHIDAVSQTAFGTTQCVKTIGAAGMPTLETEINVAQRSSNGVTAMIYPNPTQGQMVNFSIQGLEGELQLKVTDAMGREVYNNRYIIEGEMNTTLEFGQALSNGVYMVEMMQNGILQTMRMVVSK